MNLSKTKLNLYSSLSSSKMRKKHCLFMVEGLKSVKDTIDYFNIEALICLENSSFDFLNGKTNIYHVNRVVLNKISGLSTSPDIIAIYKIPEITDDIPVNMKEGLFVVLDGIQDPGNLGTIVRTCHWFGINKIFASHDTVDIFNPKTIQATMGSLAKIKITYCNLEELFNKNPELPVYGLLLDGYDIFTASLEKRGFILFGNEGKGISQPLRKMVTNALLIPPGNTDHSESLNVSVASGITIARFVNQS